MTLLILYLLALTALVVSLVFIPLILVTAIPLSAVYYHSLIRKPVAVGPLAMISRSSPTTSDMIKLRILAGCANSRNQAKDLIAFCGTAQQIHDRYTGINAVLIWQRMTRSHDPAPVNASRVFVVGDGNGLYALARWNML